MTDKDTLQQHISDQKETQDTPAPKSGRPVLVWIAVLLALLSWVAMMFVTGYVALALGVAAIAVVFWACARNERAMRKLAITAIIAATVLVVVLAAFLIVIKIGLSA